MNKITKKLTRKIQIVKIFAISLVLVNIYINSALPSYGYNDNLRVNETALTKDQYDFYHVIGLIQNIGNQTLDNVYVTATITDNDNSVIGNFSNQVAIQPLNPSEITPFDILIYDKKHNEMIENYIIDLEYNTSDLKHENFQILSTDSRLDLNGFYYITGKVQNTGNATSNSTTVVAATLDKEENLLGIWKAPTEPYDIFPQGIASFTIPVTDKTQSFKINNYTLYFNST